MLTRAECWQLQTVDGHQMQKSFPVIASSIITKAPYRNSASLSNVLLHHEWPVLMALFSSSPFRQQSSLLLLPPSFGQPPFRLHFSYVSDASPVIVVLSLLTLFRYSLFVKKTMFYTLVLVLFVYSQ